MSEYFRVVCRETCGPYEQKFPRGSAPPDRCGACGSRAVDVWQLVFTGPTQKEEDGA